MPALLKFSALFTELEDEVVALDKRRTDIIAEVSLLGAKRQVLSDKLAELEILKEDSQRKYDTLQAKHAKDSADLDEQIGNKRAELTKATEDHRLALSEIETSIAARDKELIELTNTIKGKKDTLVDLDNQAEAKKAELQQVKQDIVANKEALVALDKQVVDKATEVASETARLGNEVAGLEQKHKAVVSKLDAKQEELEDVTQQVIDKQADISSLETKRKDFIRFEEEAKTALKVREDSLAKREHDLEVAQLTSRRRTSVLDRANEV